MEQAQELWMLIVGMVALIAPVIGFTGGIKALFDKLPDLTVWKFTIKDGVWVSWLMAALLLLASYGSGWLPLPDPSAYANPFELITAQWVALSTLANFVYSSAYKAPLPSE